MNKMSSMVAGVGFGSFEAALNATKIGDVTLAGLSSGRSVSFKEVHERLNELEKLVDNAETYMGKAVDKELAKFAEEGWKKPVSLLLIACKVTDRLIDFDCQFPDAVREKVKRCIMQSHLVHKDENCDGVTISPDESYLTLEREWGGLSFF